jgi:hypothetical protein
MFIDQAEIIVKSGRGGDGMVHFRREKYVPRGGPDGGDGGRGGDVVLEVRPTLNTLAAFRHVSRYAADDGRGGGSQNRYGRGAADLFIPVPPGTVVRDAQTGRVLADLTEPGQEVVAAHGGRGGRGNARFATSGINVGLFCATPGVALSRNLGRKQALELLLTGDFIDAATAKDFGLVNRVVPIDQLDAEVKNLANSIIAKSSIAISMGKQMFYRQIEMGVEDAYKLAAETMACNMMAEDAGEGIDAFMQKRPPTWKGR